MAEKKTKTAKFAEWRAERFDEVADAAMHADAASSFIADSEETSSKAEFYDVVRDACWELQVALDLLERVLDGEEA